MHMSYMHISPHAHQAGERLHRQNLTILVQEKTSDGVIHSEWESGRVGRLLLNFFDFLERAEVCSQSLFIARNFNGDRVWAG
jgi:hypothetical protein